MNQSTAAMASTPPEQPEITDVQLRIMAMVHAKDYFAMSDEVEPLQLMRGIYQFLDGNDPLLDRVQYSGLSDVTLPAPLPEGVVFLSSDEVPDNIVDFLTYALSRSETLYDDD